MLDDNHLSRIKAEIAKWTKLAGELGAKPE